MLGLKLNHVSKKGPGKEESNELLTPKSQHVHNFVMAKLEFPNLIKYPCYLLGNMSHECFVKLTQHPQQFEPKMNFQVN